MKIFSKDFSNLQLGSQLRILVVLCGFLLLALATLGSITTINHVLKQVFLQDGENIATVLAERSKIGVLVGSPANAMQAVDFIEVFPDVRVAEVFEISGDLLARHKLQDVELVLPSEISLRKENAYLEFEDDSYGVFVSPVIADLAEPELEDVDASRQEKSVIGFVRVVVSKSGWHATRGRLLAVNLIVISITTVLFFGFFGNWFDRRVTSYIADFTKIMEDGADGKENVAKADFAGSSEAARMSSAFNTMVRKLRDRELELAAARDSAITAAALKSEFAANVSHEVRTPLNGIVGTLNLLSQSELTPKQREYISMAEGAGDSLMAMINDILDFSRLSVDSLSVTNIKVDLLRLLEEVVTLHSQSRMAKKLEMYLIYDPVVPRHVEVDANKLRQLLNNLINNAVKFTNDGEVVIEVSLVSFLPINEDNSVVVNIAVRDTGIGISESDLANIFMPYAQSDGSSARKYGGTGLGLAISERLSEVLGGDMGVRSQVGEGSEFFVRLPLRLQAEKTIKSSGNNNISEEKIVRLLFATNPGQRKVVNSLALREGVSLQDISKIDEQSVLESANVDNLQALEDVDLRLMISCKDLIAWHDFEPLVHALLEKLPKLTVFLSLSKPSRKFDSEFSSARIRFIDQPIRLSGLYDGYLGDPYSATVAEQQLDMTEQSLQGVAVLLAEDNELNQMVAETMLKNLGAKVSVANNGLEAVEQVSTHNFDVVIMDCQMPEMDGFEATQIIRAGDDEKSQLPIVAMTANVESEDRLRCFECGMNDFVSKPVKQEQLARLINNLL